MVDDLYVDLYQLKLLLKINENAQYIKDALVADYITKNETYYEFENCIYNNELVKFAVDIFRFLMRYDHCSICALSFNVQNMLKRFDDCNLLNYLNRTIDDDYFRCYFYKTEEGFYDYNTSTKYKNTNNRLQVDDYIQPINIDTLFITKYF